MRERQLPGGERRDLLAPPVAAPLLGFGGLEQLAEPVGEIRVLERLLLRLAALFSTLFSIGLGEPPHQEVKPRVVREERGQGERENSLPGSEPRERRHRQGRACEVRRGGEPVQPGEITGHDNGACLGRDHLERLQQAGRRAETGAQDLPLPGDPAERAVERRRIERAVDLDAAAGHIYGWHGRRRPLGGDPPPEARLLWR